MTEPLDSDSSIAAAPKDCGRAKLHDASPIEWRISSGLTPYPDAVRYMESRAADIASGKAAEQIWCVEHPPLYSAGTSAKTESLLDPSRFEVFESGRGGQYTYHGPGQRVAYFMLDLKRRGRDVGCFISGLEQVIIDTLAQMDVEAGRRKGRIGVWVSREDGREEKIAAIGVRLRKWVSFHGIAINVTPDLSHFTGIVPCGISEHGVASLASLGKDADMNRVDSALKSAAADIFGPLQDAH